MHPLASMSMERIFSAMVNRIAFSPEPCIISAFVPNTGVIGC